MSWFRNLTCVLLLLLCSVAQAQTPFDPGVPLSTSKLNQAFYDAYSCHAGTTEPENPQPYWCWWDTSSPPAQLKYYIGGAWVAAGNSSGNATYGRMSGMTVVPTGNSYGVVVNGSYFAGQKFSVVSQTLTLPNLTQSWYLVGDGSGVVSLTPTQPPAVWPPTNATPVLLATITPNAAVAGVDFSGVETDGTSSTFSAGAVPFAPLRPGTVQARLNGVVVATDNGTGGLTGGTISSGTINYTNGAFSITFNSTPGSSEDLVLAGTYLPPVLHKSWVVLYPPVDNPAAQARKAAFDAGFYKIPGKDISVGLPTNMPQASLSDLAHVPIGCDGVGSNFYFGQTSQWRYQGFFLYNRTFEFGPANESNSISVVNDGAGHVALSGFPTANNAYLDPANIMALLSDGNYLGQGFTGDCFGELTGVNVPSGIPFTGQTVTVKGGGIRDVGLSRFYIDMANQTDGVRNNGPTGSLYGDLQSGLGPLSLEDGTIIWSEPTNIWTGGSHGIANIGPVRGRNLMLINPGVGIYPVINSDYDGVFIRQTVTPDGVHGAGVNFFGQSNYVPYSVGGVVGWSSLRHFNLYSPCQDCPGGGLVHQTGGLAFETNGTIGVGVGHIDISDGLIDGGGNYPVSIDSANAVENSPITNVQIHDVWISKNYEFDGVSCGVTTGPVNILQTDGGMPAIFGPILLWNLFDRDTGEVLDYLTGSWSNDGSGCAVKAALPATDINGNPIFAVNK